MMIKNKELTSFYANDAIREGGADIAFESVCHTE